MLLADPQLVVSESGRDTAGILLLTIVTIESGGWYLLKVARGQIARTELQQRFERAGHAHAGVLVMLSLIGLLWADATDLSGLARLVATNAVPLAAILMPAGFFFSVLGKEKTKPNGLIALIYLGAASLAAGVLTLGIGLLTT